MSYPIRIQVQLPEGVRPVEGLSATADIVLREDTDVLLVPLEALYGTFEQPLVRVVHGGGVEERPVVVGNTGPRPAQLRGGGLGIADSRDPVRFSGPDGTDREAKRETAHRRSLSHMPVSFPVWMYGHAFWVLCMTCVHTRVCGCRSFLDEVSLPRKITRSRPVKWCKSASSC